MTPEEGIETAMNSPVRQAVGVYANGAVVAAAPAVSGFGFASGPSELAAITPTTTPSDSATSTPPPDSDAPGDTGRIPGVIAGRPRSRHPAARHSMELIIASATPPIWLGDSSDSL